MGDGKKRSDVRVDDYVSIVLKKDQPTGELTEGVVKKILTNARFHPHGIKVMLDTGEVGRVKIIHEEE